MVTVQIPETGQHYQIQSGPGRSYYLMEVDTENQEVLQGESEQPSEETQDSMAAKSYSIPYSAPNPTTPVNIDLMIVYTPAATIPPGNLSVRRLSRRFSRAIRN